MGEPSPTRRNELLAQIRRERKARESQHPLTAVLADDTYMVLSPIQDGSGNYCIEGFRRGPAQ